VSSRVLGAGTAASAAGADALSGVCACAATASVSPKTMATKRFIGKLLELRF
jgi:hypothetical protein